MVNFILFPIRLYTWRTKNKISRSTLANKIQCSQKALQNWESGKALPSVTLLAALADEMGVSINWLLGEEIAPCAE
jgi:transcriptional regulator with XRE-family HTH domain